MNNLTLLLFSPAPDGLSAKLCTYSTIEGTLIADAKIICQSVTRNWEVYICIKLLCS